MFSLKASYLNFSGLLGIIWRKTDICLTIPSFLRSEAPRRSVRRDPFENTTVESGNIVPGGIVDIGDIVQFYSIS